MKDTSAIKGHKIRCFLFDLDLTLIDSLEAIVSTIKLVLDSKSYPYDDDKIAGLIGIPLEDIFKRLVATLSASETWECVNEYRKRYASHHLESTKLYPGVKSVLRNLKGKGFKLGIITGKYREPVHEVLNHFNLMHFFDVIVTGYEVERRKPAPDLILEATRKLGVKASECVVVGDSTSDIEAGKIAGALTIATLTGLSDRQSLEQAKPDFVIESIESITEIVPNITIERDQHMTREANTTSAKNSGPAGN